jgi:hypothetical protein
MRLFMCMEAMGRLLRGEKRTVEGSVLPWKMNEVERKVREAIMDKDFTTLDTLIRVYPTLLQWRSSLGITLLHFCVWHSEKKGAYDLAQTIIGLEDYGVLGGNGGDGCRLIDVQAEDVRKTALHDAVSRGSERMVRLLMMYGADPNIKDKWGQGPLDDGVEALGDQKRRGRIRKCQEIIKKLRRTRTRKPHVAIEQGK